MNLVASLRENIGRGASKGFRFPNSASGGGYGSGYGYGWGSGFGLLPGTDYDYVKASGICWHNGIVMTALGWICGAFPEAKLVIHRPRKNDKPEVITDHPALDLIATPNADYDDVVLFGGLLLSMIGGNGNGYLFKQRAGMTNVRGLQYIPHYMIRPQYPSDGTDYIRGYLYQTDGKQFLYPESEVVHLKNPRWPMDPANTRMAMHPLLGELRSVANDNEERSFSAAMLRNMGWPGALLSPKNPEQSFTAEQNEQLKSGWKSRVSGDNRGMPFASTIPIDVHAFAFSPEQLATDKLARMNIARICAIIGIDPLALGLPSDTKTYSNVEQARKAAYQNMLMPLQAAMASQLTRQLIKTNDLLSCPDTDRFGWDYSEVACLQESIDEQYKRLSEAVKAGWISPNDARIQVGLEEIEGGDELRPAPGMGGGMGQEGQPPVPRAASLSPKQAAIAERWQVRAEERRQLALNGHS
jgi:HK97 family phage portal protein